MEEMIQELQKAREVFEQRQKRKEPESDELYLHLMKKYDHHGRPFRDYALALLSVGDDVEKAVSLLLYSLILSPNDIAALLALAEYFSMGYGVGIPYSDDVLYDKVLHLAPDDHRAVMIVWIQRASYLSGEACLHACLQAVQAEPTNIIPQYNVAMAYWEQGQFLEAERHFRLAEQLTPETDVYSLALIVPCLERVRQKDAWTSGSMMFTSVLKDWYEGRYDAL